MGLEKSSTCPSRSPTSCCPCPSDRGPWSPALLLPNHSAGPLCLGPRHRPQHRRIQGPGQSSRQTCLTQAVPADGVTAHGNPPQQLRGGGRRSNSTLTICMAERRNVGVLEISRTKDTKKSLSTGSSQLFRGPHWPLCRQTRERNRPERTDLQLGSVWPRSPTAAAEGRLKERAAGARAFPGEAWEERGSTDLHLLLRKEPVCPQRLHGLVSLQGQGLQHHLLVTQRPLCVLELGSSLGGDVGLSSRWEGHRAAVPTSGALPGERGADRRRVGEQPRGPGPRGGQGRLRGSPRLGCGQGSFQHWPVRETTNVAKLRCCQRLWAGQGHLSLLSSLLLHFTQLSEARRLPIQTTTQ